VSAASSGAGRTSAAHVLRCVLGTGLRFAVWASVVNLAYSVRPRRAAVAARMPSMPRLPCLPLQGCAGPAGARAPARTSALWAAPPTLAPAPGERPHQGLLGGQGAERVRKGGLADLAPQVQRQEGDPRAQERGRRGAAASQRLVPYGARSRRGGACVSRRGGLDASGRPVELLRRWPRCWCSSRRTYTRRCWQACGRCAHRACLNVMRQADAPADRRRPRARPRAGPGE